MIETTSPVPLVQQQMEVLATSIRRQVQRRHEQTAIDHTIDITKRLTNRHHLHQLKPRTFVTKAMNIARTRASDHRYRVNHTIIGRLCCDRRVMALEA